MALCFGLQDRAQEWGRSIHDGMRRSATECAGEPQRDSRNESFTQAGGEGVAPTEGGVAPKHRWLHLTRRGGEGGGGRSGVAGGEAAPCGPPGRGPAGGGPEPPGALGKKCCRDVAPLSAEAFPIISIYKHLIPLFYPLTPIKKYIMRT